LFASYKSLSAPIPNDPGLRQLELFEQFVETVPIVTLTLTATVKPFEYNLKGMVMEGTQHIHIPRDAIVVEVSQ
jgi:hypothetical protein